MEATYSYDGIAPPNNNGGKFLNGAISGAVVTLFNRCGGGCFGTRGLGEQDTTALMPTEAALSDASTPEPYVDLTISDGVAVKMLEGVNTLGIGTQVVGIGVATVAPPVGAAVAAIGNRMSAGANLAIAGITNDLDLAATTLVFGGLAKAGGAMVRGAGAQGNLGAATVTRSRTFTEGALGAPANYVEGDILRGFQR